MKYYFLAGERSGDLHASNLIKQLKLIDPKAEIRALGGALMRDQGAKIFKDYADISFMGFLEVVGNIFSILRTMKSVKSDILQFSPDVVILVDFAGFNMKIAAFAKMKGFKVFYYISPKIWAWNQKRVWKIKKLIDRMFVILPFEKDFYQKYNYTVDYIGNPVNDAINNFSPQIDFKEKNNVIGKPVIALLPGSRKQEVEKILNTMSEIPIQFPDHYFVVAAVSNLSQQLYQKISHEHNVRIVYDSSYDLLNIAHAAVVTSGTATLETALFGVPQVVVYKTSPLTYHIIKMAIKVRYISLVNLIADKAVVKELIQEQCSSENIITFLNKIVLDSDERSRQLKEYGLIKTKIEVGSASENAARLIFSYLS
jgi:lipid-A-disaccharide synthase